MHALNLGIGLVQLTSRNGDVLCKKRKSPEDESELLWMLSCAVKRTTSVNRSDLASQPPRSGRLAFLCPASGAWTERLCQGRWVTS